MAFTNPYTDKIHIHTDKIAYLAIPSKTESYEGRLYIIRKVSAWVDRYLSEGKSSLLRLRQLCL